MTIEWKSTDFFSVEDNKIDQLTDYVIAAIRAFYYPEHNEADFKIDSNKLFCIFSAFEQIKAGLISMALESVGLLEDADTPPEEPHD